MGLSRQWIPGIRSESLIPLLRMAWRRRNRHIRSLQKGINKDDLARSVFSGKIFVQRLWCLVSVLHRLVSITSPVAWTRQPAFPVAALLFRRISFGAIRVNGS